MSAGAKNGRKRPAAAAPPWEDVGQKALQALFESLPIGVSLLDRHRAIVYANPALERILKTSRADLLSGRAARAGTRRFLRSDGTTMLPEEFASIRAFQEQHLVADVEVGIVLETGETLWTSVSATPFPLIEQGVLVTTVDITDRKRMESEIVGARNELEGRVAERTRDLAAAVEKLHGQASLLELAHDAIIDCALDGTILYWNHGAESMYGWTREEAVGRISHELLQTRAERPISDLVEMTVRNGRWEGELSQRDRDGRILLAEGRWALRTDEGGRPAGILKIQNDITERKKAEAEKLRLAKALEQTAESILILDTDREILYVNPVFERISGLRAEDILRSTYDDILLKTGREEGLEKRIEEALQNREHWRGRVIRRRPEGQEYEMDVSISPVLDEAGRLTNFVIVERDVTAESRLLEHVRLRQKMEALGTLAGGIAHDFNNILMPITINAEMAMAAAPEGGEMARVVGLILEAARRGRDLVKQITTFSRQRDPEKSLVAVAPVLKEGLKLLRASLPANIEIVEDIRAAEALALADGTQIHQILMNLCSNAAYAMRGGGTLTVGLSEVEVGSPDTPAEAGLRPGPYLRLTVTDTGAGMSPEVLNKAFDPFFTTKPPGEGTGMGLAVVHGIVENHGGIIRAVSEKGRGSRFDVYLPRVSGPPEAADASPRPLPRGAGRILFVDDEALNVDTMVPTLKRLGYGVVGRTDPVQALQIFNERPGDFDLVITDFMMPRLTGEKLAEEIRRRRPDMPIILATGFSETLSEERLRSLGLQGLLAKPYTIREIDALIRSALAARS